jgi:hypothetical protein
MPMRGLTAMSSISMSRCEIHNASPRRLSPSSVRSMFMAMQILPGPFISSQFFFAFGLRSRIDSMPRNGSAPRSSTASAMSCSCVTTLRHQCMPYVK